MTAQSDDYSSKELMEIQPYFCSALPFKQQVHVSVNGEEGMTGFIFSLSLSCLVESRLILGSFDYIFAAYQEMTLSMDQLNLSSKLNNWSPAVLSKLPDPSLKCAAIVKVRESR